MSIAVNDIHSRLNATEVAVVTEVDSLDAVQSAVREARARRRAIAVAGGHHAMGGQQFLAGGTLLDTRPMNRVLSFDREQGLLQVEAGIQWPHLVDFLSRGQGNSDPQWGIAQKQTGADRFTIGGSVAANCHGRGLIMPPIVADIEAIRLVQADGSIIQCSREQNKELFGLAIGGYGLFGVIYAVTLRLAPRRKLERIVEMTTVPELIARFADRIARGSSTATSSLRSIPTPLTSSTPASSRATALSIEIYRSLSTNARSAERTGRSSFGSRTPGRRARSRSTRGTTSPRPGRSTGRTSTSSPTTGTAITRNSTGSSERGTRRAR